MKELEKSGKDKVKINAVRGEIGLRVAIAVAGLATSVVGGGKGSGDMIFSSEAYKMLKHIELPYNLSYKNLYHHDTSDKPNGIYPYDVFDNGITTGYGHHVSYDEVNISKDQNEINLLNQYGVLGDVIK